MSGRGVWLAIAARVVWRRWARVSMREYRKRLARMGWVENSESRWREGISWSSTASVAMAEMSALPKRESRLYSPKVLPARRVATTSWFLTSCTDPEMSLNADVEGTPCMRTTLPLSKCRPAQPSRIWAQSREDRPTWSGGASRPVSGGIEKSELGIPVGVWVGSVESLRDIRKETRAFLEGSLEGGVAWRMKLQMGWYTLEALVKLTRPWASRLGICSLISSRSLSKKPRKGRADGSKEGRATR